MTPESDIVTVISDALAAHFRDEQYKAGRAEVIRYYKRLAHAVIDGLGEKGYEILKDWVGGHQRIKFDT